MKLVSICPFLFSALVIGSPSPSPDSWTTSKRQSTGPVVNLGYAQYEGSTEANYGLNVFKGIRYAAPPTGKLRWQAPQDPLKSNSSQPIQATTAPPTCPQSGGAKLPTIYGFLSGPGDEDCLFLNVYAPSQAKGLPVVVWIHGGGYGNFGASLYDPSAWIQAGNGSFIAVMIQYRLGAFGFLSSDDVHKYGQPNAGLLDQRQALKWVQQHIGKFGGDPTKVTLGGESAGAASVMLQAMAYGGTQNTTLFNNLLTSSVYVAKQFNYNDPVPTQYYQAFAKAAGCAGGSNSSSSTFECLVNAPTAALQNASGTVSESGLYGTWAFLPVTDGKFITQAPSQALAAKAISGKRLLLGNNADDGAPLTPPTVLTGADFTSYVDQTFPSLTANDKSRLMSLYQFTDADTNSAAPLFATLGDRGPTAINQSGYATGQKQRAYNLNNEATFTCPGYWLTDAFASAGRQVWKYQYSVQPSFHGGDLGAIFSIGAKYPTPEFAATFQKIWANFIVNNDPSIPLAEAGGNGTSASSARMRRDDGGNESQATPAGVPSDGHGSLSWPQYTVGSNTQASNMMNLNTTGGTTKTVAVTPDYSYTVRLDPGVSNSFRNVDAYKWEGGRGERCQFWDDVAPRIPQ